MTQTLDATSTIMAAHVRAYKWVVLVVATIAQLSACFLVQGLGVLAPYIQKALSLTASEIGLLMSAAQLVPIIGLLIAGELLDRFGERMIVGLGSLIVAAALAGASRASGYMSLLFWLIFVGAGYSTAQPGGSKSVSQWFPRQRGLALGIRQAGLPMGGALAALILPHFLTAHDWHTAFLVGAAIAFSGGMLFISIYRSPSALPIRNIVSTRSALSDRFSLLQSPGMSKIMWSGVTLISVQYGILIFMALYLRDRFDVSLVMGARLLFIALCSGAVGRIILAAWSDRCSAGRYLPVVVSMWALVMGLLVLLISGSASPLFLTTIAMFLGFFGFGWYGPWVALVTESTPPNRVGFALGLAMAINQVAVVGTPPVLGALRDWTGSYTVSWLALIVMLAIAAMITQRSFKRTNSSVFELRSAKL